MSRSDQRLALLEAAVAQSYNAVLITDAKMTDGGPFIVYANPAFCAMTGYSLEQLLGKSPHILQGDDTDPEVIQRVRECLKEHRFFEGSTVNYRSDGSSYVVQWNISPVRDKSDTVTHFVSVQQNISQRICIEQDRDLLAQALNVAPDPVFITDRSSTIVFANEAFHLLTGYEIDDIIGKKTSILHSTNHDEAFFVHFKKSQQKNKVLRTIFTNKHRNGSVFYTEQSISALLNSKGDITHYVSISRDVSERVVREKNYVK
ncbi:MAG: Nitrogen fixation regulatory protein [Candidatus Erwinia impunctatus]|nr:Nitrogen fixation regulatory protein [Culicoides impunctatus]